MDDIGSFLIQTFQNYTAEMYSGNAPCGKGHTMISGEVADRWETKYGGGETVNGEILFFSFSLSTKITIYLVGDALNIVDNRYAGKTDEWCYCNNNKRIHGCADYLVHDLEPEIIEKILNTSIPNCKIWEIVQARAKELYKQ